MRAASLGAFVLAALLAAGPVLGQDMGRPLIPPSPVVVLDQDRLFSGSAFGSRVLAEAEADTLALAAENRQLEQDLAEAERDLLEARAELPPDDFRVRADAFDARVIETRERQDRKAVEITRRVEAARSGFFEAAVPVLLELMRERGHSIVLDGRAVLLSFEAADITDAAIAAVDARIGESLP